MRTFVTANCTNFHFPVAREIRMNNILIAKIAPIIERGTIKSLIIEGKLFKCYEGVYLETIDETIYIGENEYDSYRKESKFYIYIQEQHNQARKILIETNTSIGIKYLKRLEKAFPQDLSYSPILFDFRTIVTISDVGSLWFKVEEQNVNSKGYFGTDIELNPDVDNAITENRATYVSVNMDVANISRALGFSKKGAVVIRNNITSNEDNTQYLVLLCQIFQLLNI